MYTKPIELDFEKIYESNSYGPFKIIENMGRDERSRLWIKIKFLNTGYESIVRYDIAMDGRVKDQEFGIDYDKIYMSNNYGPFKIIENLGTSSTDSHKKVRVKFINTGYETDVVLRFALLGVVKDGSLTYAERVKPVLDKEEHEKRIIYILKTRWKAMMDRCYNSNSQSYAGYGVYGVKVCDYWHDVNNYIKSIPSVLRYRFFYQNPTQYFMDKDYLQLHLPKEQRIYSPETCIFLSLEDNSNLEVLCKFGLDYIYGVKQVSDSVYRVYIRVDGIRYNIGDYSNLLAAANIYNTYYVTYCKFDILPIINRVNFMDYPTCQQYLIKSYL